MTRGSEKITLKQTAELTSIIPYIMTRGPIGPKVKENSFPNKNWIFEFTKALEICRKRFRRNFGMRIFPKFF
jgi:hypothetical protein